MRVIIDDQFYEFQNQRTEEIFNEQKDYLSQLVQEKDGDMEYLLTALFSLYNLSEALIEKAVKDAGVKATVKTLQAKLLK